VATNEARVGEDGLQTRVVTDVDALSAEDIAGWDALALAAELPFCAPAWMLGWWRASHRQGTQLRVILVRQGARVVGVGPFFANPTFGLIEMRLLGAGFSHRIGVLAERSARELVAPSIARALAGMRPASVVFEGVDSRDPWPEAIARDWPGRLAPKRRADGELQAPVIDLQGDYEQWLDRRERRFRKEARRNRRRMDEQGVSARMASDEQAIDALLRLHHARWDARGGSNVEDEARAVLSGAAAAMPDGRLLVALLEHQGVAVSAELVVCAGGAAAFWGGGFDPDWAQHGPGIQTMLFALGCLADRGVATADLGGGAHTYKRRMADETTTLQWLTVFPRGWRYPLIRLRLAPKHIRLGARKAARRLPPGWQRRLRALLGR
jgi:CelD/BcsL family acetyltransferase involved in cellulose biosynthesis